MAKRAEALQTTILPKVLPSELDSFYRELFLPLVRRAVRRQGLSLEDAGDVVQDAFLLALGKLDATKNPKAWLYQVVDHLSLNWRRKRQRHAALLARWTPAEEMHGAVQLGGPRDFDD